MKQKINIQLGLIALIAVLTTTIGVTFVYYNLFQNRVKSDLHENVRLLAETELFQRLYDEAGGDAGRINREALALLNTDTIRITWISSNGTVLYDNDTGYDGLSNHLDRPEIQDALNSGFGECIRNSDTLNYDTFYSALKLDDGTILRVSTKARSITSVFLAAAPVIIIIVFMVFVLCIFIGHMLTIQLMRPINLMAENIDSTIDIREYKELEPFAQKIRSQHEKILEAATMRQDFTANVSHELKTPLTAISGYAELIENNMVEKEQEGHIASQIKVNANRLVSLINDIIKLSELDHVEMPRKFEKIELREVMEECCRNLGVSAQQHSVSLKYDGEECFVNGDRDLIKELIENLVQNAIRYNRPGGWVEVKTSKKDGHSVIVVADNGIGIAKDKQERVFERFYRVDKGRSRETGGTGLGLAIVKHIVEIHNAEISLESARGDGTTVTIEF